MVPVGGHTALVSCAVAVRTSGGSVAGEDIPESDGGQKVVKETWAKIREDDFGMGCSSPPQIKNL